MTGDFASWARALPPGGGRVHARPDPLLAEIVLDDAAARNALGPGMMVGLRDAVEAVRGARVILLRGAHGTFCSGGNLDAVRDHLLQPGAGQALGAFMQATCSALADVDGIVLGVLEGAAIGGGAELLTCCDRVFAAPSARIGWTQARLAVSPGFGGGARLVRRVGSARALGVLLAPRLLGAQEALVAGLVDEVTDAPEHAARAYAAHLSTLDPGALRAAKAVVRAASRVTEEEARAELAVFTSVWGADAHVRAVRSARG